MSPRQRHGGALKLVERGCVETGEKLLTEPATTRGPRRGLLLAPMAAAATAWLCFGATMTRAAETPVPAQVHPAVPLKSISIPAGEITTLFTPTRLGAADRAALVTRADAGDIEAIRALAKDALGAFNPAFTCCGFSNDAREASVWWRRGAALGDQPSMIMLGYMYGQGWGVPQDQPQAAVWLKQAADKDNLTAIQGLSDLYSGAWSDERNEVQAVAWIRRAATLGDPHALLILGLRYDVGWGVREDPAEAARWYLKVLALPAGRGSGYDRDVARNNLGAQYQQGRGVPMDEAKAVALYRKAAMSEPVEATYNLAVLCEAGRGVPQDRDGALWLYRHAALLNRFPPADEALARLHYSIANANAEAGAQTAHDKSKVKTACDP
jgi:TPR repeat protein